MIHRRLPQTNSDWGTNMCSVVANVLANQKYVAGPDPAHAYPINGEACGKKHIIPHAQEIEM